MSRGLPFLVFFGVLLAYAGLSPGTIWRSGYNIEEMRAGDAIIGIALAYPNAEPGPPMQWNRHGLLPIVLDLPFLIAGRYLISEDFVFSFSPVLETALLVTVLFLWLRRLTSPALAFLVSMAAAFATMLWPYAYIGLEPKQSLFLMLAGYLSLVHGPIRSYPRAIAFAVFCGLALGMKSTGIVLLPVVAWLVYREFHSQWRKYIPQLSVTLVVIGFLLAFSTIGRTDFWAAQGKTQSGTLAELLVDSPFQYLGNLIGVFGSPVKGLLLFAPPVLAGICSIPAAWRAHRDVTLFVLLSVGGLVAGFSCFRFFADEVWGPRYLHAAVAPLLLLIGAAHKRFTLRSDGALLPLAAIGLVVSFLGASYYYGVLHYATKDAGQNTEQELVGDPQWNHIWYNARLLQVWARSSKAPALWTPSYHWMYAPPPGTLPPRTIDLRPYSVPQFFLVWNWKKWAERRILALWIAFLLGALSGIALLTAAAARLRRSGDSLAAAASLDAVPLVHVHRSPD